VIVSDAPLLPEEAARLEATVAQQWPPSRVQQAAAAGGLGASEARRGCAPLRSLPRLSALARMLGSESNLKVCQGISSVLLHLHAPNTSQHARAADASAARRLASCAVVGGSGVLTLHPHGPLIDSHQHVFRVNACPVRGFEARVGARTSIRFVNAPQSGKWLKAASGGSEPFPTALLDTQLALMWVSAVAPLRTLTSMARSAGSPIELHRLTSQFRTRCVNPMFTADERSRHFASNRVRGLEITFGFEALMHAVYSCERVSVFGFFLDAADMGTRTNSGKRMSYPYHYWENTTFDKSAQDPFRPWTYPFHNFGIESEKMQDMRSACLLERYVTDEAGQLPRSRTA